MCAWRLTVPLTWFFLDRHATARVLAYISSKPAISGKAPEQYRTLYSQYVHESDRRGPTNHKPEQREL